MSRILQCDKCRTIIKADSIGAYRLAVTPLGRSAHPGVEVDLCPECSDGIWGILAERELVS